MCSFIAHSSAGNLDFAEQLDDCTRINKLDLKRINECNWSDFKEEKQAEFLVFESVAWHTIRQIGVKTQAVAEEVSVLLQAVQHKPEVIVRPQWYY